MSKRFRVLMFAAGVAAALSGLTYLHAQAPQFPTAIPQTKFDSGQNVVPVYEGWIKNPDGSFDLVFGYFNRNYKEELAIPAGPDNSVEPGGPDRGQPTYFLPRRRARLFRVRVPGDWGRQTLTWTLVVNGRAEKRTAICCPSRKSTRRSSRAAATRCRSATRIGICRRRLQSRRYRGRWSRAR